PLSKRVAGEFLCDLHDLFLIDHDPVGLGENLLHPWMVIFNRLYAMPSSDKRGDYVHRAWTIEREHRDNLFKFIQMQLAGKFLHTSGFYLEHTKCLALVEKREGKRIVNR